MREEKAPRIITPMPQSMINAIDDFRFGNRLPSRAEAIRCLIERGLAEVPNAATRAAMSELEAGKGKSFATVEGLMADLNADD